jgi:nucleoside phosphorylase
MEVHDVFIVAGIVVFRQGRDRFGRRRRRIFSVIDTHRSSLWNRVAVPLVVAALLATVGATSARAATPSCTKPVLVLSAMPLELSPILRATSLDTSRTVDVDGRTFYAGRLGGHDVVLAMTRIGLTNATETATLAFDHFRCPFSAVVFSGVAGSRANIGDVAVPSRWSLDGGGSWMYADRSMVRTAARLADAGQVPLAQDVPVGDAACACPGVDAATPVHMPQPPKIIVGGDGMSSDTYGGHALPCVPGGGDIAGCAPCLGLAGTPAQAADFAARAPSLADPAFVQELLQPPEPTTTVDAQDQETAAVAAVASKYGVPFLGIRAVSDGQGDPLHLPGFPSQFVVYRQLAGNNAAAVTIAFLRAWRPTKG